MDILLSHSLSVLAAELEAAGHRVRAFEPGEEIASSTARVAIVEGANEVHRARLLPHHLVALLDEHAPLPTGRALADIVLTPLRAGELALRLARIETLPSYAEEKLQRVLALAVERTSDVVEVSDPVARLEYVNPAYERTLGIPRAEAIGKTPAQLVRSTHHPPEFWQELDSTLARGEAWTGTMVSRARSGRHVHFDTTVTPLLDEHGRISHHLGIKRDITERIGRSDALTFAVRALGRARDAAVAASRAKSEFLANVSHELRTPLNAILGYADLLAASVEAGSQAAADAKQIRGAAALLLALVDDLLDISKLEADQIELNPETFAVRDLVEGVEAIVRPLAEKNGNALDVDLSTGVRFIHADRPKLRQVLVNLLSNACKFTKDGLVSLAVDLDGERITFRVRDTGIGIAAEHRDRLFQPFTQADASSTRVYGGTGLGLAICKRLVDRMGGTIELATEIGRGTTFFASFPVNAKVDSLPAPPSVARRRVLVVDDDVAARDRCADSLRALGYEVEPSASGAAAIERAERHRPDAIVLDVEPSGWDTLSRLKLSERTAPIPVVMVARLPQDEVARTLGAAASLPKPLDPSALAALLQTLRG